MKNEIVDARAGTGVELELVPPSMLRSTVSSAVPARNTLLPWR